ncbi:MAG: bacillithiol biosynthesis deacetylase BshB1 [Candidatus Omnitrophota bacterium]
MNDAPLDMLIFAPHPDDAELGMGGTILKSIAAGKRVGVIDLTRGELGTKGDAAARAREAHEASQAMGLHYRGNLDLGDGKVADNEENRRKAIDAIRRFRSSQVYVCPPFDRHPDHQAAAKLIQAAFFLARLPKLETEYPAFSPRRLFYYFIHDWRTISFAVDITGYFPKKKEILLTYRSQFIDPDLPPDYRYIGTSHYFQQIEAYNRTIGAAIGVEFAEGYFSESPISLPLPTNLE